MTKSTRLCKPNHGSRRFCINYGIKNRNFFSPISSVNQSIIFAREQDIRLSCAVLHRAGACACAFHARARVCVSQT